MFCIPASLVFGIIGVILDERKLCAIIATIIAGGLVAFYMMTILMA